MARTTADRTPPLDWPDPTRTRNNGSPRGRDGIQASSWSMTMIGPLGGSTVVCLTLGGGGWRADNTGYRKQGAGLLGFLGLMRNQDASGCRAFFFFCVLYYATLVLYTG